MSSKGSVEEELEEEEEQSIWSLASLDAILVALWTMIIGGSAASLLLDAFAPKFHKELLAQGSVVAFILLSAYRAGANHCVDALTWYTSFYFTFLLYSVVVRGKEWSAIDLWIEHVFYAMFAFVCLIGAIKMYRYYIVLRNKKRKKRRIPVATATKSD